MPPLLLVALVALVSALLTRAVGGLPLVPLVGIAGGCAALAVAGPWRLTPALGLAATVGATAAASPPVPPDLRGLQGTRSAHAVAASSPLPVAGGCTLPLRRLRVQVGRRTVVVPGTHPLRLQGHCPAVRRGERLRLRARLYASSARPTRLTLWGAADGLARLGSTALPPDPLQAGRTAALRRLAPWRSTARAVLAAVLVGDRRWLPTPQRDRFRHTGTAHLLAISGLHVALVTTLLFGGLETLLRRVPALVRRVPARRPAALVALVGTWAFVGLSGGAPSALRAGWMATAFLLGHLAGRRADPWAALGLAALFVTLWEPGQWLRPGCQLSFAAVTGLLLAGADSTETGAPPPAFGAGLIPRLRRLLRATAVASLCTAPLAAYHFGQVTAAGLLVNLVAVPLLCLVVVPLGGASLLLSALLPSAGAVGVALAAVATDGLLLTIDTAARWLAPLWGHLSPTALQAACAYGVLFGLWRWRTPHGRHVLAGAAGILTLSAMLGALSPQPPGTLQLDVLAVGDGDALLVTLPDGRHGLVDAPGRAPSASGPDPLVRRLRRRGVRRLTFVVATHPHADHVGGLPAVLRALPVDVVFHSGLASARPEWQAVLRAARAQGVPLRVPATRRYATVRFEVLAPRHRGRVAPHPLRSENDNSLVLRLRHPAGSLLLTGDLERAGEAALLRHQPRLHATVLKAGHHGRPNGTSPALLRAVRPRVAVISARAPERGRVPPQAAVLRRLARARVPTWHTGRDGDVTVRLSPWGLRVTARHGDTLRLPPDRAPCPTSGWITGRSPGRIPRGWPRWPSRAPGRRPPP